MKCSVCGSYAINHHLHGRDGSDPDLCDVCYWRERCERRRQFDALQAKAEAVQEQVDIFGVTR